MDRFLNGQNCRADSNYSINLAINIVNVFNESKLMLSNEESSLLPY